VTEREHFEDLNVNERRVLKWVLKESVKWSKLAQKRGRWYVFVKK
jgi:hypothetical protein